jgi:hypothetical protein
MIEINEENGAAEISHRYAKLLMDKFPDEELVGAEMGICFGGGVEFIGNLWKGRGKIYGFDTFEDKHPKQLGDMGFENEMTCMEHWYTKYGVDKLTYEYQRGELDRQGLDNVTLIKGLVTENSCKDNGITKLHYALLDMDILASMTAGYAAVAPVIVSGGYLILHDVPNPYIHRIEDWYAQSIKNSKLWAEVESNRNAYTTVLLKI